MKEFKTPRTRKRQLKSKGYEHLKKRHRTHFLNDEISVKSKNADKTLKVIFNALEYFNGALENLDEKLTVLKKHNVNVNHHMSVANKLTNRTRVLEKEVSAGDEGLKSRLEAPNLWEAVNNVMDLFDNMSVPVPHMTATSDRNKSRVMLLSPLVCSWGEYKV